VATDPVHRWTEDDLPRLWGRYELTEILGSGGCGRVFGAELLGPAGFRKPVALKVLLEPRPHRHDALLDEARLGARLHHPHIVDIYDVGVLDGLVYIAMERVDGCTAHDLLLGRPLPSRAVIELGLQLCDALDHAHSLRFEGRPVGLVHQDVKPGNVLIDRAGRAHLADFGLARASELTRRSRTAGSVEGTVGYIAPEQLGGESVDQRADLFSLGVTLLEVALGRRAFDVTSREEYAFCVVDPPQHLATSGALDALAAVHPGLEVALGACLARDPAHRIESAADLAQRLRALRGEGPSLRELVAGEADTGRRVATEGTRTLDVRRHNLGPEPDPLVGRRREAKQLSQALGRGGCLVSLIGPGGVGKTRLARKVGRDLAERQAREVWFCDLAEAADVTDVIRSVASTLGLRVEVPDDVAALARGLALRGPLLLLLDNAEQAVDSVAAFAFAAAAACPELATLVTSREPLHLAGEQIVRLGPLSPDEAAELFRLRTDRPIDRAGLDALLDAVDRLPLAVEMAAGLADVLPPETLLREVPAHPSRLRGRRRDLPDRHGSIDAALRWSWKLLEPWEQSALVQLCVFRGGFDVQAAEHVLDLAEWPEAPWTLFVVEGLIDKSLIRALPPVDATEPRFAPFMTVRSWVEEVVRERRDDHRAAVDRHLQYFALCGEREFAFRVQGADARRVIAELQAERDNLRVAFERGRALDHPAVGMVALGLVLGFDLIGAVSDAQVIARDALDNATLALEERVRLRHSVAASMAISSSAELVDWAEETLELARRTGSHDLVARALIHVASASARSGDVERARTIWGQARQVAEASGDPRILGEAMRFCGQGAFLMGLVADARRDLEAARDLHRQVGHKRGEAIVTSNLASACWLLGDVDRAKELFEEARLAHRDHGDRRQELTVELNLTLIEGLSGLPRRELRRLQESSGRVTEALRRQGDRPLLAVSLGFGALAGLRLGEDRGAELEEALALLRSEPRTYTVPQLLNEVARYHLDAGQLSAAEQKMDEISRLVGARIDRHSAGEIEALRGRIALRRNDREAAEGHAEASQELFASAALAPSSPACRDLHALRRELDG